MLLRTMYVLGTNKIVALLLQIRHSHFLAFFSCFPSLLFIVSRILWFLTIKILLVCFYFSLTYFNMNFYVYLRGTYVLGKRNIIFILTLFTFHRKFSTLNSYFSSVLVFDYFSTNKKDSVSCFLEYSDASARILFPNV